MTAKFSEHTKICQIIYFKMMNFRDVNCISRKEGKKMKERERTSNVGPCA